MSTTIAGKLPRTIWILWLQGFARAPSLVRRCLDSWRTYHPQWQIVELDDTNLRDWLDLDAIVNPHRQDVTRQVLSDVIRINLLAEYGGVWVDATTLCSRPLDHWVFDCVGNGFFAFQNPGPDRLISSWFLASTPNCHLTRVYRDTVNAYWRQNVFVNQGTAFGKAIVRRLGSILNVNTSRTRFWFSTLVRKGLRVYPYHWFHYLMAEILRGDPHNREIWASRTRLQAADGWRAGTLRLQSSNRFATLSAPLSDTMKAAIDSREIYVWKLSYKKLPDLPPPGSALDYLLRRTTQEVPPA
jgi:hypothetical protein